MAGFDAKSITKLVTLLCLVGLIASLLGSGYVATQKKNIKVGTPVMTTFTGCPTMLTTALVGKAGEYFNSISDQDAVNAAFCDEPGAVGTYSGWLSTAGINWQSAQPSLCQSASNQWFSSYTCHVDADCRTISHLKCGSAEPQYQSIAPQYGFQCGPSNLSSCTDAASGVCVITDPTYTATCGAGGICQVRQFGATCPVFSCTVDNGVVSGCFDGQGCDTSAEAQEAANLPSGWGTCTGEPVPHVVLNVNWRAEGTVTALNDDGTANVGWDRVMMLYNVEGPREGWWYTNCRFVRDPADNTYNATASNVLLGDPYTAPGASVSDPAGFIDIGGLPPWYNAAATLSMSQLLMVPQQSGTFTAWNLLSNNVPVASLSRAFAPTIKNLPITASATSMWTSLWVLASQTYLYA
jgi:hypothetical protein